MSDIKYIIAGKDGENTGFPFLAMVRYAMAAAVSMVAVAVIVLVVHAVLRSEDVHLSVNNGYIGADSLWERTALLQQSADEASLVQSNKNNNPPPSSSIVDGKNNSVAEPGIGATNKSTTVVAHASGVASPDDSETNVSPDDDDSDTDVPDDSDSETDVYNTASAIDVNIGSQSDEEPLPKECFLGCNSDYSGDEEGGGEEGAHRAPTTQSYTLHKANTTNLRVILIASNPSGRTKIDCSNTTVSLIDMHYPYKRIGDPLKLENFTVLPQTTITMQKRLTITDTTYIWNNYGGEVRFSVKVQVSSTVISYPLGKQHIKQQKYTCQPVTVGLINDEAIFATDQVDCWAS